MFCSFFDQHVNVQFFFFGCKITAFLWNNRTFYFHKSVLKFLWIFKLRIMGHKKEIKNSA